jgi:transposase
MIVFDYQQGRSGEYARQFLGGWTGHLMVDDYVSYKALFSKDGKINLCIDLACLAHARRKFFDLHQANQSLMALQALQHIAALYAIEALSIDARQQLRAEKSLPQLQVFHNWLLQTRVTIANGGASAKALDSCLNAGQR